MNISWQDQLRTEGRGSGTVRGNYVPKPEDPAARLHLEYAGLQLAIDFDLQELATLYKQVAGHLLVRMDREIEWGTFESYRHARTALGIESHRALHRCLDCGQEYFSAHIKHGDCPGERWEVQRYEAIIAGKLDESPNEFEVIQANELPTPAEDVAS